MAALRLRFSGDLPSSPVGMLCSPGRIHRMGPAAQYRYYFKFTYIET